jgi:hypothetical protein
MEPVSNVVLFKSSPIRSVALSERQLTLWVCPVNDTYYQQQRGCSDNLLVTKCSRNAVVAAIMRNIWYRGNGTSPDWMVKIPHLLLQQVINSQN